MTTELIIERFCNQCAWTRSVFNEYRVLYERGQKSLDLLFEVSGIFFQDINRILVEYIYLNMSKLTDPAHSGQDDNLSVKYILELIDDDPSKDTSQKLGLDLVAEEILNVRPYIKDVRHKVIAHSDKETLLSQKKFGEIPPEVLASFWDNLQKFVDIIYRLYFSGPFSLDATNIHGAENLTQALKEAVHYNDYFKGKLKYEESQKMRYKDA